MTKDELEQRLLDLKTRQASGETSHCPRCGRLSMKKPLEHNALSRHADLYVCDDCGRVEAVLDMMDKQLPLEEWAGLKDKDPLLDFKALSMKETLDLALSRQLQYLRQLHEAWVYREEDERFDDYREQALSGCPGLSELWENPFCAVYQARDGCALVRFRWADGKSEVKTECLPER